MRDRKATEPVKLKADKLVTEIWNQPLKFDHHEFKKIDPTEYFRLVIDGFKQEDKDEGSLGWMRYERRERFSVLGLLRSYQYMLTTIGQEISLEMIKIFHQIVMEPVVRREQGTLHDLYLTPGIFRDVPGQFGAAEGSTLTPKGLQNIRNSKYIFISEEKTFADGKKGYQFDTKLNTKEEIEEEAKSVLLKYKEVLGKINQEESKLEIKEIESIRKKRLLNIVSIIQQLEHIHLFNDGNCRIFCIIVLTKLLLESGFSPVILYDPNRFDGCSPEELVKEAEEGMKRFYALQDAKVTYPIKDIINMQIRTQQKIQNHYPEERINTEFGLITIPPLHWAIVSKIPGLFAMTLEASKEDGDLVNSIDASEYTPLMVAAQCGDVDVLDTLLKNKHVDVNAKNQFGYSAVMIAAELGHSECVKLLLSKKVDTSIRSKFGQTLTDIQRHSSRPEEKLEKKDEKHSPSKTLGTVGLFKENELLESDAFEWIKKYSESLPPNSSSSITDRIYYLFQPVGEKARYALCIASYFLKPDSDLFKRSYPEINILLFLYSTVKRYQHLIVAGRQLMENLKKCILKFGFEKISIEKPITPEFYFLGSVKLPGKMWLSIIDKDIAKDFFDSTIRKLIEDVIIFYNLINLQLYFRAKNFIDFSIQKGVFDNSNAAVEWLVSRPEYMKLFMFIDAEDFYDGLDSAIFEEEIRMNCFKYLLAEGGFINADNLIASFRNLTDNDNKKWVIENIFSPDGPLAKKLAGVYYNFLFQDVIREFQQSQPQKKHG